MTLPHNPKNPQHQAPARASPAAAGALAAAAAGAEPPWGESKEIMTLPAKPSTAPAQSPAGTASPASVHSRGVKMMDARIRNAPFAIVVIDSP